MSVEQHEWERFLLFDRFYRKTLRDSKRDVPKVPFSETETLVLVTVAKEPGLDRAGVASRLGVSPGSVGRAAKSLLSKGFLKGKTGQEGRGITFFATEEGLNARDGIESRFRETAEKFFQGRTPSERDEILSAMAAIMSCRKRPGREDLVIRPYRPGELGIVSRRHCVLYNEEYAFDGTFENYLLEGLSRFLWESGGKGEVWVVDYWGLVLGSIAIVETGPREAQLRWFYLEPRCRGLGMGKSLMETAMGYCRDRDMEKVFLWTVKDLEAARHLYGEFGFSAVETNAHFLWGREIVEEKWEIRLKG